MRRTALFLAFVGLGLSWGACEPTPTDSDAGNAEDVSDIQPETTDAGPDAAADAGTDAGGCSYPSDCADDEICIDSECRSAPTCGGPADWGGCVSKIEEMSPGLGKRTYCDGEHCQVGCILDEHCPDGELCTDFGSCREFEGSLDAEPPGGEGPDRLRAGVAQTLLEFPIGLSLGGYGSRREKNDGRYVESLRDTHGQMHGLYARALALDDGDRKLLMVRLPIIFSTSALHEAVARRLQSEVGGNWRGSLLISATHTHSGPARFYHLPRESLVSLGRLGIGSFHDQAFQWLVDSTVSAAKRALDDLEPARLGTDIVEGFDTDDAISRDRRSETPQFDDNRLLLVRIDDDSGTPRAVAVSFGTHGTIHGGDYFNGDALAGIERGLERALADEYGRHVPVLFFNQNGGTMSPGGDDLDHGEPQRFEKLGHAFAERTIDEVRGVETDSSLSIDGTTYRFPITYEQIGYAPGAFGDSGTVSVGEGSFYHGAFQCTDDGDDDYSSYQDPETLSCFSIRRLLHHRPPTLFLRSQMSAFRLGDVRIVTLPGELSMELSWRVLRRLREEQGLDPAKTWTLGFAQDHQFYLNPDRMADAEVPFSGFDGVDPEDAADRAFSYLQGGYEAKMSFWGWKFGDYLVDRAADTVERLDSDDVERQLPEVLPTQYSDYGSEEFPVETSDPETVGDAVDQPPQSVERFETVEYAWIGGDPGAELPQAPRVALQRDNGNGFRTLEAETGRPYTNREPVMLTRLRQEGGSWVWVVRWEEGRDLPTGTYRFAVQGSYQSDSDEESYETQSRTFDVTASDDLDVQASESNGLIQGTVGYPAGAELDFVGTSDDPGAVEGNFRLRDPRVPTGVPSPLAVGDDLSASDVAIEFRENGSTVETVTGSDLSLSVQQRDRGGASDVPTTAFTAPVPSSLSAGTTYQVVVRAADAYGNEGSTTFQYQTAN